MTKASQPDTADLVAALLAEHADAVQQDADGNEFHPERARQVEQQLEALGASIPSSEEE